MTVDPRLTEIVHSLETLPIGTGELVRFVPDDGDDRVADIVQSTELFDEQSRCDLRTLITDEAKGSLRRLARRRVVLGERTSNVSYFHQALSAFSLLPTVDDIPWRTWFVGAVLLGAYANDPDIVALFEGPFTAGGERCSAIQKSLKNGGTLAHCHLARLETNYGVGMIALPTPEVVNSRSWNNPIEHDDALYAPTINLAQIAVDAADAFDKMDGTRTSVVDFAQLADGATGMVRNRGCLHFSAMMPDVTLDVSVAEMMNVEDANDFCSSFDSDGAYVTSEGAVVLLFMEQPSFDDDVVEKPLDTSTLSDLARGALHGVRP
jgi:hypothetical protein